MSIHIILKHKISGKEYYDKYIGTNVALCPICGTEPSFVSIDRGYGKYCSKKCMFSSVDYRKQQSLIHVGHRVSRDTAQKISKTLMGHPMSIETNKKISNSKKGTKMSRETISKMSASGSGHVVSSETRKKISIRHTGMKGISPSVETRLKLSQANKGRAVSAETRKKLRMSLLRKAKEHCAKYGKPFIHRSTKEIECIDKCLQPICAYRIDTDFQPIGYMLDGYVHEINLAIEFDEKYHDNFRQKVEDGERQTNIEKELGCRFFRIREQEWKEDKVRIISMFKQVISECENNQKK